MSLAEIKVELDQEQLRKYVNQKMDESIHHQLLLIDINKLAELTSMSVRYLEDEFLSDPRVKIHERKKNRKRWWLYEPVRKAIKDIVDEW